MNFPAALAVARSRPKDEEALHELARCALAEGEEERALDLVSRAVSGGASARLWQWKGLLERSLDDHQQALASFAKAAQSDPSDASIAHGRARVALEAGSADAEELFELAQRLAPNDGSVLLGLAAARFAAGKGERAASELDAILGRAPLWIEGHAQLGQLRSMLGFSGEATASLERALAADPSNPSLWHALFDLHIKANVFARLDEATARARAASIDPDLLQPYEAVAASELGRADRADALFAGLRGSDVGLSVWRIRHLLRRNRLSEVSELIDAELRGPNAAQAWPYASVLWRLTGDPRSEWMEQGGRLVSVIPLGFDDRVRDSLAGTLRSLHVAKGEYLDQSVRGGTQTDGPLLSRIDPVIRKLRDAIVRAVETYLAQLPEIDGAHPLLRHRRDRRVKFSGSWSVRLRDGGFHASHVHPMGWISSALYVALPPNTLNADPHAGWLHLGRPPPELSTHLAPTMLIEPKPGRLVLFPSWMWHGTFPFGAGERLTVAFDVAPPR